MMRVFTPNCKGKRKRGCTRDSVGFTIRIGHIHEIPVKDRLQTLPAKIEETSG